VRSATARRDQDIQRNRNTRSQLARSDRPAAIGQQRRPAWTVARQRCPAWAPALVAALLVLSALAAPAGAQFRPPPGPITIDAATRAAIVDSVTGVIDSVYVLAEPSQRIVAGLRRKLADGEYDDLNDLVRFLQQLEEDAQTINHDGHFGIGALAPIDPQYVEQGVDPADEARRARINRAENFGFRKAEILPGGIGYLRFDSFGVPDRDAFAAAAAAMNFLANSEALIIDLRYNGGGAASMIRFIAGYLFEEKTHLISWYERDLEQTTQSYSADFVPGPQLLEQPVYVLTSGRTASAAEEFSFDLRNHERATLVGDTTAGAGHTVAGEIFDFDGFRVFLRVPFGRAFNPENNEGWEGVGVIPHIAVPQEEALDAAHADALRGLIEEEEDAEYRAFLEWPLQEIDARLHPIALAAGAMADYVGRYGPRRIYLEDGALHYQREGRPAYRLEAMAEDLFLVGDLDYFRLAFGRDEDGKVVKVIGCYNDGHRDENARDDG
jgi:hypothetical protein